MCTKNQIREGSTPRANSGWKPDGIIIDGGCATRKGARLLSAPSLRGAVFVNADPPLSFRRVCAHLTTDDRALAIAAARLLKGHGLRHFAFVGSGGGEDWSVARECAFRKTLETAGFGLSCHIPQRRREPRATIIFEFLFARQRKGEDSKEERGFPSRTGTGRGRTPPFPTLTKTGRTCASTGGAKRMK